MSFGHHGSLLLHQNIERETNVKYCCEKNILKVSCEMH